MIETKDAQVTAVKETVATEVRSYSDVLKCGHEKEGISLKNSRRL